MARLSDRGIETGCSNGFIKFFDFMSEANKEKAQEIVFQFPLFFIATFINAVFFFYVKDCPFLQREFV